jgi:hypothetical protein
MKRLVLFAICVMTAASCASAAGGRTLTFDDVASGSRLRSPLYRETYRVTFDDRFRATDHTESPWGPPHSGANVMTLPVDVPAGPGIMLLGYFLPSYLEYDYATSIGGYFSTQTGVQVRITAYYVDSVHPRVEAASAVIGAPGESWNNRYVEISSPGHSFSELQFEGVKSSSDLQGFCMDDMTIDYVPEPSSLLALAAGLGALGVFIRRRRR